MKYERQPKKMSNGRRPNFFGKWKTTSIFPNGRRPKYSCEWKTTSNSFKWKTTSIFLKSEDDLRKIMQPKTIEIKTMVVAPGNLVSGY